MTKTIRRKNKETDKKSVSKKKVELPESDEEEKDTEQDEEEEIQLNDEELAIRKSEFETETLPHMSILKNYAKRITMDTDEADDLVQDTYMRAYRFFHKFEKGTNSKAWLFRIMKNLFINNYRKNQKMPDKVDYDEVENFFETIKSDKLDSSDMQEKVFSSLLDDEVTRALNTLQDDFKTVIILCDIEGLSYEEIADFVQCPIGTIRSRLHRARKMLQEKLSGYAKSRGYEVNL
jgi:RNA polymerase sigma-70 factor (ECF subfamily)